MTKKIVLTQFRFVLLPVVNDNEIDYHLRVVNFSYHQGIKNELFNWFKKLYLTRPVSRSETVDLFNGSRKCPLHTKAYRCVLGQ